MKYLLDTSSLILLIKKADVDSAVEMLQGAGGLAMSLVSNLAYQDQIGNPPRRLPRYLDIHKNLKGVKLKDAAESREGSQCEEQARCRFLKFCVTRRQNGVLPLRRT